MRRCHLDDGGSNGSWAQVADLGERIAGRYQVLRHVNVDFTQVPAMLQSGCALVYQALAPTGQRVGVKQCLDPQNPDLMSGFQREAQFLLGPARGHGFMVQAIETFTWQNEWFLVLEWLEGETVQEAVARGGPLARAQIRELLQRGSYLLEFLHRRGYVHRDFSPGNTFLTPQGVKWLDFGSIREQANTAQRRPTVIGPCAAPEIVAAFGQQRPLLYTPSADLYGLCATVYFAATGQYVPEDRVCQPHLTPIQHLRSGFDPLLAGVIMRGLEVEPGRRFSTAAELRQALTPAAAPAAIAVAAGLAQPQRAVPIRPRQRQPLIRRETAILGAVAALGLIRVGGIIGSFITHPPHHREAGCDQIVLPTGVVAKVPAGQIGLKSISPRGRKGAR